jgi:hypothetical protein
MAFYIEHRLGVAAPAAHVWRFLGDVEGWSAWAPLYARAEGRLRIGETVVLEQALAGETAEIIAARVVDWAPEMQIHLAVRYFAGLVVSTRYFEIEKLSETGCVVSNGEMFKGAAAGFMPRSLRRALKTGFAAFGEALKAKAEAAWRSEAGLPISPA